MLAAVKLLLVLGCWLGMSAPQAAEPNQVAEDDLKAALTYKLAKYVAWPADAFDNAQSPFVMCVVGDEQLARAFRKLQQRPLHARTISVRRVSGDTLDLRRCHLAFFTASQVQDLHYTLETLSSAAVLTIGDGHDFATQNGMVSLLTRDDRVTFTVNLPASKRAGLVISSQLLQLASVVGSRE